MSFFLKELTYVKGLNFIKTFTAHTIFDGINEVVSLPNGSTIFLPLGYTEATWSFWMKTTSNPGIGILFMQYDGGSTSTSPLIIMLPTGHLRFYVDSVIGGGLGSFRTSLNTFNSGNWVHFAGVYKGSTPQRQDIYINGNLSNGVFQKSNL